MAYFYYLLLSIKYVCFCFYEIHTGTEIRDHKDEDYWAQDMWPKPTQLCCSRALCIS